MNSVATTINKRIKQRGISVRELGRRTGISSSALYRSLSGNRPFRASELLAMCAELGLGLSDFEPVEA